jgi:hypothetical protein
MDSDSDKNNKLQDEFIEHHIYISPSQKRKLKKGAVIQLNID